jgi:hypothetical protein
MPWIVIDIKALTALGLRRPCRIPAEITFASPAFLLLGSSLQYLADTRQVLAAPVEVTILE